MYLFIVNPNAGNGEGRRTWNKISKQLRRRGIPYEHALTDSKEQAHTFLQERLSSQQAWKAVGVVGGDGTIHSLLPALRHSGVPLAVFSAGSGNDTARGFGLPRRPLAALDVMLHGRPESADLIAVSGRSTLTALAVGFDAEVARNVNRSRYKKICNALGLGRLAYIIGIFHTLLSYRPGPLNVDCDGIAYRFESAWLTAINNVDSYGGGLSICPGARPGDGVLDLCVVHDCSKLKLLLLFPTVLFGAHTKFSFVTMLRGRNITVSSPIPRLALGDGEEVAATPLNASADPGAIQILRPAEETP
ncbi:diacylglycerol/lipid kinase family protein [Paenibacillus phocaensis]|uniref:diacylglycerol/lipid kinase family protein n=1 Tax=Paenibacillus phocaensis TaxID=1776378 RepID=UPI00039DDAA7|nr:diacylglycerol kinase family protein [Paenibacillus phocaensis]